MSDIVELAIQASEPPVSLEQIERARRTLRDSARELEQAQFEAAVVTFQRNLELDVLTDSLRQEVLTHTGMTAEDLDALLLGARRVYKIGRELLREVLTKREFVEQLLVRFRLEVQPELPDSMRAMPDRLLVMLLMQTANSLLLLAGSAIRTSQRNEVDWAEESDPS